jgi:low affinity Fe/Cu permease
MMHTSKIFSHFARAMARILGHPLAFGGAVLLILGWLICGPIFHFSDTWQLVINTSTTIITFLMVFLIQNTQNRDSEAVQVKLDELILSLKQADNSLLESEDLTEHDLERLQKHYARLAHLAQTHLPRKRRAGADITSG